MGESKKFNNCMIVFDENEFGTYLTGQTVSGKVVITLEKPKKLKGIKLEICGFAACQWREKFGKKLPVQKVSPTMKNIYFGREDYFQSTKYLEGSEHGSNFNMNAGTYSYTFSCPIPTNCPSSFEGSYGHIRYMTKVTFMRNGAADRVHNVGFTVLKLLDLNQESNLLKFPASNDTVENVCFFLSKAVHLKVDLQQTGYVPGQFMLVSADVNNQSSADCKHLIITVNLRATYNSDIPALHSVSEKICLAKNICGDVPRYTHKAFAETIRVPATAPTCQNISKFVRVSYELCVEAVMSTIMHNPKTVIPITIGCVPLTEEYGFDERAVEVTSELENESSGLREVNEEDASEGEELTELPPPTYEEAMFMSTNIADNDANIVSEAAPFTPRYPVFNVDEINVAIGCMGLSPPPNLPRKRRRRKRRCRASEHAVEERAQERPSTESPIQI